MAVDLLDRLLALDPTRRLSAAEALQHDYFWQEQPFMIKKEHHPKYTERFNE